MSRKHYIPAFFVGLAGGLIGGGISGIVLEPTAVFAQRQLPRITPKMLRSEAFEIVDRDGRVRGVFAVGSDDVPAIRLYDAKGGIYWSTGKTGMLPAQERP